MTVRKFVINFLIWSVLTCASAAIAIKSLDWQVYRQLVKHGVATQGHVIAKEPENHRSIRYSYSVGQQTYTGLGKAGRDNPQFEELKTGDSVKIIYDPVRPEVSFLGNPQYQLDSITRGVFFITFLFPLFSLIALHAIGKKIEQSSCLC